MKNNVELVPLDETKDCLLHIKHIIYYISMISIRLTNYAIQYITFQFIDNYITYNLNLKEVRTS